LQGKNIILKNKDGEDLYTIKEEFFEIIYFTKCLSQVEIEDYNKKIGNANFLINLYNQQRKKEIEVENEKIKKENRGLDKDSRKAEIKFEKLSQFKILYKQIGCGEKKEFITLIKNDNELMKTLLEIRNAGQKYFVGESKIDEEKNKIDDFANLLKNHNDYKGIYWNKQAINTISGKYFANWHDLQDKLKDEKVFQKADKNSDEKIKIPDAVELSDLFAVLDYNIESNWRDKGIFFKTSLFEGDDKDRNIKMINELLEK
jgi:hypothetical protein